VTLIRIVMAILKIKKKKKMNLQDSEEKNEIVNWFETNKTIKSFI